MSENTKNAARPSKIRFSTLLLTTIVLLVTAAVAVNLIALNQYFIKSVRTEFYDKLRAQKGQVNILVENRIARIHSSLKDLVDNNAIRVTLMLEADDQLQEKLLEAYPPLDGVYYFIQRQDDFAFIPRSYPEFPTIHLGYLFNWRPLGELFYGGSEAKLIWLFSIPIMHKNKPMGTAFVIYDLLKDKTLLQTISRKVDGDVCLYESGRLVSPLSGSSLPVAPTKLTGVALNPAEFVKLDGNLSLSPLARNKYLHILYSLEKLNSEIQNVTLYMGLVALLALSISIYISVYLGKKLMNPLKALSQKASQVSKGEKDVRFDDIGGFWEFEQLSQAFDFMITHLREAEEKSRYQELLEKVDDAVYLLDEQGRFMDANAAVYRQLGYKAEDFFDLNVNQILPAEDAQTILGLLSDRPDASVPKRLAFETSHIRRDGTRTPVEIRSQSIEYTGQPVILNVARDISLRIEMESALRESEERYRSVVENSSDGIMIIDEDGRITYANELLAKIFGHPRQIMLGSRLVQYLDFDSADSLLTDTSRTIPDADDPQRNGVFQIVRRDGEKRQVKIRANHFSDSSGRRQTVAQVFDITDQLQMEAEKKQLEEQFLHAQKLEAIGTLAGGIAHDFNNLLMGIQGRLSMMRLQMDAEDLHLKNVEAIENIVSSAANLTRQLLGFARKGRYEIKPVSINDLIEKSTRMFIRTRKEIQLQTYLQPETHKVEIDPGQIEQVLINIYVNAWQAMPNGGTLIIETRNVHLDEEFCKAHEVESGQYVKIVLKDTGIGMDTSTMKRIFEPFFTTKGVGKGTGLGLASAYGIIRNHKGIIQVESEMGQGTSFLIYLPACRSVAFEEAVETEGMIEGQGTVLIVDDELESLQAEEAMLQRLGYDVLAADNGSEALRIFKTKREDIDLVTLDMIMPGMGGMETFEKLRQIDPDVKILFISGYGINHDVMEVMQDERCGFLDKPFDIVKLSHKVSDFITQPKDTVISRSTRDNLIKFSRFSRK